MMTVIKNPCDSPLHRLLNWDPYMGLSNIPYTCMGRISPYIANQGFDGTLSNDPM